MTTSSNKSSGKSLRRGKPRSLDPEKIIAAALALIDEVGVDGLSMRNLGQHLGVDAMTIYGYFENKAALLAAIVGHEADRIQQFPEPMPTDPVDLIVFFVLHYREVLLEHPNLAPLVIARPLKEEQAAATAMVGLAILRAADIPEERLVMASGALVRFSLGFLLHEALQSGSLYQLGIDRDAHHAGVLRALHHNDASPMEVAIAERQSQPAAAEEEFEAGLRAMVAGFQDTSHRPA